MYWFHPAPEEQIWQGLPARDEGEDSHAGGAPPQGNSATFPPGCSAGKVKMVAGFDLISEVNFSLSGSLICTPSSLKKRNNLLDIAESKQEKS